MNLSLIAETLARPGLFGVIGQRSEKRLQRDLESFFRAFGRKVEALNLEQLVTHSSSDIARHAVEMKLYNLFRVSDPLLKGLLAVNIQVAMLASNRIHHMAEADIPEPDAEDLALPSYTTGEEAALYASVRSGELVSGINDTTREKLADVIETGIDDSLGVDGTARLLRQTLDGFSTSRAQMIASTEMNDAFSEATMRKLDRLGIGWKQWITAGACCDECADNEDASPIPLSDSFPSGDDRPPAHPSCRCTLTGARAPEQSIAQ